MIFNGKFTILQAVEIHLPLFLSQYLLKSYFEHFSILAHSKHVVSFLSYVCIKINKLAFQFFCNNNKTFFRACIRQASGSSTDSWTLLFVCISLLMFPVCLWTTYTAVIHVFVRLGEGPSLFDSCMLNCNMRLATGHVCISSLVFFLSV